MLRVDMLAPASRARPTSASASSPPLTPLPSSQELDRSISLNDSGLRPNPWLWGSPAMRTPSPAQSSPALTVESPSSASAPQASHPLLQSAKLARRFETGTPLASRASPHRRSGNNNSNRTRRSRRTRRCPSCSYEHDFGTRCRASLGDIPLSDIRRDDHDRADRHRHGHPRVSADSAMDQLLRECRDLRTAVADEEIERLRLPTQGEVDAALAALGQVAKALDRVDAAHRFDPRKEDSALLPEAERLVEQIEAIRSTDRSLPLNMVMMDMQRSLDRLMAATGVGW